MVRAWLGREGSHGCGVRSEVLVGLKDAESDNAIDMYSDSETG